VSMTLRDIYECHADFVWRTLLRLGVTQEELGDAVQDVFVITHQHLAQFEGRSSLTTWLFTICRSVARERRRKVRHDRERLSDVDVDETIDLRADVVRAAEQSQELQLLETIMNGIDVEQRNVFVLFELEKMTGEEISTSLEIPLGTVYSRLKLARQAFRQALARHEARERFGAERAGGAA
jgi:RNA polymerase sigma-70 factor, ECF subfamily